MKKPRYQVRRDRRGTILVLVVAVLALLAVIGTVYILSAHAEKASSAAASAGLNLKLAQDAVMTKVVQVIGNAMMDGNGYVGGSSCGTGLTYGPLAARYFDYPEHGGTFGQSDYYTDSTGTVVMRDEAWLAAKLHRQSGTDSDLTLLTAGPWDPSAGAYQTGGWNYFSAATAFDTAVADQTTATIDTTTDDPPRAGVPDAVVNLLSFSDASGIRFRYGVRIIDSCRMANLNTGSVDDAASIGDTTGQYISSIRLAPNATDLPSDTPTKRAYFKNQNGTDTGNDLANAANLHSTTSGAGRAGLSIANKTFTLSNWQRQALSFEKPADPTIALFDFADELELRSNGEFGTAFHCRVGMGSNSNYQLWPYTLSADSTSSGTNPNISRTFTSSPSDNVQGNPARRNYTAFSYTRHIRPFADPTTPYTLTPTTPAGYPSGVSGFYPTSGPLPQNIWPPAPVRVQANPDVSSMNDNDAAFYIAAAATNVATAMKKCGNANYSYWAANYLAQRCNVYALDTNTGAYYLSRGGGSVSSPPAVGGPSFIDSGPSGGVHIRTCSADGSTQVERDFGSANDLHAHTNPAYVYLGYAAQPFMNEVTVKVYKYNKGTAAAPNLKVVGIAWAVELYNPYTVPLSLKGFRLKYGSKDDNTLSSVIDLGVDSNGSDANNYVPAKGYYVIYCDPDTTAFPGAPLLSTKIDAAAVKRSGLMPYDGNSKRVISLMRQFFPTAGAVTPKYCTVDQFTLTQTEADVITDPPANLAAITDPLQLPKDNDCTWERASKGNPWSATVENPVTRNDGATLPGTHTLGAENSVGGNLGIHLYDRNFETTVTTGTNAHKAFATLMEFNHVLQEGTWTNPSAVSGGFPTEQGGEITGALYTDANNAQQTPAVPAKFASLSNATEIYTAQLYMYFPVNPKIYSTVPPADGTPAYGNVDTSVAKLMDCITFIDRVADTSIDIGGGTLDVNKIRLPGLININTASGDVLRAIPGIQMIETQFPGYGNKVVGNILAYRMRAATSGNTNYVATHDYSVVANYPGKGFRSLVELNVPVNDTVKDASGGTLPTNWDDRDKFWASMLNLCSVRSDTFVVYGYLEAIKVNPRYISSPAHNNGTDWCDATATGTTDDPNNTTIKNLRLAKLRWVALVDRSWCNTSRFMLDGVTTNPPPAPLPAAPAGFPQLPKIVAIKDLPR